MRSARKLMKTSTLQSGDFGSSQFSAGDATVQPSYNLPPDDRFANDMLQTRPYSGPSTSRDPDDFQNSAFNPAFNSYMPQLNDRDPTNSKSMFSSCRGAGGVSRSLSSSADTSTLTQTDIPSATIRLPAALAPKDWNLPDALYFMADINNVNMIKIDGTSLVRLSGDETGIWLMHDQIDQWCMKQVGDQTTMCVAMGCTRQPTPKSACSAESNSSSGLPRAVSVDEALCRGGIGRGRSRFPQSVAPLQGKYCHATEEDFHIRKSPPLSPHQRKNGTNMSMYANQDYWMKDLKSEISSADFSECDTEISMINGHCTKGAEALLSGTDGGFKEGHLLMGGPRSEQSDKDQSSIMVKHNYYGNIKVKILSDLPEHSQSNPGPDAEGPWSRNDFSDHSVKVPKKNQAVPGFSLFAADVGQGSTFPPGASGTKLKSPQSSTPTFSTSNTPPPFNTDVSSTGQSFMTDMPFPMQQDDTIDELMKEANGILKNPQKHLLTDVKIQEIVNAMRSKKLHVHAIAAFVNAATKPRHSLQTSVKPSMVPVLPQPMGEAFPEVTHFGKKPIEEGEFPMISHWNGPDFENNQFQSGIVQDKGLQSSSRHGSRRISPADRMFRSSAPPSNNLANLQMAQLQQQLLMMKSPELQNQLFLQALVKQSNNINPLAGLNFRSPPINSNFHNHVAPIANQMQNPVINGPNLHGALNVPQQQASLYLKLHQQRIIALLQTQQQQQEYSRRMYRQRSEVDWRSGPAQIRSQNTNKPPMSCDKFGYDNQWVTSKYKKIDVDGGGVTQLGPDGIGRRWTRQPDNMETNNVYNNTGLFDFSMDSVANYQSQKETKGGFQNMGCYQNSKEPRGHFQNIKEPMGHFQGAKDPNSLYQKRKDPLTHYQGNTDKLGDLQTSKDALMKYQCIKESMGHFNPGKNSACSYQNDIGYLSKPAISQSFENVDNDQSGLKMFSQSNASNVSVSPVADLCLSGSLPCPVNKTLDLGDHELNLSFEEVLKNLPSSVEHLTITPLKTDENSERNVKTNYACSESSSSGVYEDTTSPSFLVLSRVADSTGGNAEGVRDGVSNSDSGISDEEVVPPLSTKFYCYSGLGCGRGVARKMKAGNRPGLTSNVPAMSDICNHDNSSGSRPSPEKKWSFRSVPPKLEGTMSDKPCPVVDNIDQMARSSHLYDVADTVARGMGTGGGITGIPGYDKCDVEKSAERCLNNEQSVVDQSIHYERNLVRRINSQELWDESDKDFSGISVTVGRGRRVVNTTLKTVIGRSGGKSSMKDAFTNDSEVNNQVVRDSFYGDISRCSVPPARKYRYSKESLLFYGTSPLCKQMPHLPNLDVTMCIKLREGQHVHDLVSLAKEY